MKLSSGDFEKARAYLERAARPVDWGLFACVFEGGPASAVIEALEAYQNPDGGFGRALEPDFRMGGSSPLATTVAFQYLRAVGAAPGLEMVRRGLRYFLASFDPALHGWRPTGPEVMDAPHAPWWVYGDPEPVVGADGADVVYFANPSAEITGYFHAYPGAAPADFVLAATRQALDYLDLLDDPIEPHTLLCYLRLEEALPEPERTALARQLRLRGQPTMPRSPADWASGYVVMPHVLAPSPGALLAEGMVETVKASLEFEIPRQDSQGFWGPTWAWGQFEDAWSIAEVEWRGQLTTQMLIKLHQFG